MGRIIPYIMENKNMFQTTNQGQIGKKGGKRTKKMTNCLPFVAIIRPESRQRNFVRQIHTHIDVK